MVSAEQVGRVRGTGIVSSAADVICMSVVRRMSGVCGVCEMCKDWVWALPIMWEQRE